jgi:hypothetical protein
MMFGLGFRRIHWWLNCFLMHSVGLSPLADCQIWRFVMCLKCQMHIFRIFMKGLLLFCYHLIRYICAHVLAIWNVRWERTPGDNQILLGNPEMTVGHFLLNVELYLHSVEWINTTQRPIQTLFIQLTWLCPEKRWQK